MRLHTRLLATLALTALGHAATAAPIINEIMYRPGTGYPENTGLEFIELFNPGTSAVDLSGWALTDGVSFTFPSGTTIAAGGFLVVAANPTTLASSGGYSGALGPWDGKLSNDGETITLSLPDASTDSGWATVDSIDYADEGDWATRTRDSLGGWSWVSTANSGGKSLERRNPDLVVDNGQNWGASSATSGSPGAINSLLASDIAPVITAVKHAPAVPRSTEPVTISCRLTDESAATALNAILHWRNATTTSPGSFSAVAMTGDGTGRFTATLAALADKQIVEFYIQATDGTHTRTWPAPSSEGQNTNCTYQVDNEAVAGTAPVYRLILTAAENSAFTSVNTSSDRQFNVTLVATRGADATIRYLCGMRIRGNSSRQYTIKPLRFHLPSDNKWDAVDTFLIGPRGAPLQYLAHTMQRAAGLVAADATPIEVRRQGVEYTVSSGSTADYGQLVRVEAFDSDYLDNHFPNAVSSQIYRKVSVTSWSAASTTAPTSPDSTWSGWSKESDSAANDWSDVIAFSSTWQNLAASHFTGETSGNVASGTWDGTAFTDSELATLATVVDLDYLARWLAVMTVIPNNEPNISTGEDDDYAGAFVSDGTHTRLFPLPHDMDTTFGLGENSFPYNIAGLYDATESDTTTQRSYRQGLGSVTLMAPLLPLLGDTTRAGNTTFRTKYLTAIRELFGSIFDADTSSTPNPPFHQFVDNHLGDWVPSATRTTIKTFMTNRQSYLLGLVGSAKIAPTDGTSSSTRAAVSTPTVRINEVLASNSATLLNGTTYPDVIELHNSGASAVDLAGKRLTDYDGTTIYSFPSGTSVAAGGYLTVFADSDTSATGLHTGFSLDAEGDAVLLYDTEASGGALLDSIEFGFQIADRSVSRLSGSTGTWGLAAPTLGAANGAALTLGDVDDVVINEWAGSIQIRTDKDFLELYNPASTPVALGGVRVTDDYLNEPSRYDFRKLSFLAAGGHLVLDTDKLEYGLDGTFDMVFLLGENGAVIDRCDFSSQAEDTSTGRTSDGAASWSDFAVPTPGLANDTALPSASSALLSSLRVTELMYKPVAASSAGNYEFIELQNIGTATIDLSGVRFTNGIDYTFASGTTLAPGAHLVVCKNRTAFLARYPAASGVLAGGAFTGALDNSGETIALTLPPPWDVHIQKFRYESTWYPLATDHGYSIVVRTPTASAARDWDESWVWAASAAVGGNPGGFAMTNSSIAITSATTASATVGTAFSYQIIASETPTSYAATGLPTGLSLDTSTGAITGSPATAGSYAVDLTVATATSTGSATLTITVAPALTSGQAATVSTTAGGATTLSVSVTGAATITYQWQQLVDGTWTDIAGATSASYTIRSTQAFSAGSYRVVVTANAISATGATTTITVTAAATSDARLLNISTRGLSLTGDNLLIPGFVIEGTGTKRVLIRAVGPRLVDFGVSDALEDPTMVLKRYDSTSRTYVDVSGNDNWGTNTNVDAIADAATSVGAFRILTGSADAALLVDLAPGLYSVVSSGVNATTGVAIVEVYDVDEADSPTTRLTNISNRGYVGIGGSIMIPGFVVSDEGSRTFLVRAVGPGLSRFGVAGVLADPMLTIYSGSDAILENDDWGAVSSAATTATVATQVSAFSLTTGSADAAFVVTLPPGAYTVHAKGKDDTEGIALVEIYLVP